MRFVIQRVREARLDVDGRPYSAIGSGFVVLVGYGAEEMLPENRKEAEKSWEQVVNRMLGLRVFPDQEGKMNKDLDSFGGELLLVSLRPRKNRRGGIRQPCKKPARAAWGAA